MKCTEAEFEAAMDAEVAEMDKRPAWDGCSWLVIERHDTEDGWEQREVECGALVEAVKHPGHGDGWACYAGHSHEPLSLQWEHYGSGWQEEMRQKLAGGYDLTREEAWHFTG